LIDAKPLNEQIARLDEKIIVLKRELRDATLPDYERSERELTLKNTEEALRLLLRARNSS